MKNENKNIYTQKRRKKKKKKKIVFIFKMTFQHLLGYSSIRWVIPTSPNEGICIYIGEDSCIFLMGPYTKSSFIEGPASSCMMHESEWKLATVDFIAHELFLPFHLAAPDEVTEEELTQFVGNLWALDLNRVDQQYYVTDKQGFIADPTLQEDLAPNR